MSVCTFVCSLFTQKPLEKTKKTISKTPYEIHPEVPWAYSIWPPRSLEAISRPFLTSSHRRKRNLGLHNKTKMLYSIKMMKICFTHFYLRGHLRPLEAILSSATMHFLYYLARAHQSVHLANFYIKYCKTEMNTFSWE